MNLKTKTMPYKKISQVFSAIDSPVCIQILLALASGEACVCHLEASLGLRQAYISQQLMDLRKHGLISSRREGKYIYHRIEKPEVLELVHLAAGMSGIPEDALAVPDHSQCSCPTCCASGKPAAGIKKAVES
ncbi:MAG: metalloregulator ArsR/SmtB family transcription factor [Chloroflexota bacterium]